jgi:hypothetical protein
MPVVVVHEGPTMTPEAYEKVVRKVTGGKSRLESPDDWPVEGLIFHTAGQGASGFRVVDVWESQEKARPLCRAASSRLGRGGDYRPAGDLRSPHVRFPLIDRRGRPRTGRLTSISWIEQCGTTSAGFPHRNTGKRGSYGRRDVQGDW